MYTSSQLFQFLSQHISHTATTPHTPLIAQLSPLPLRLANLGVILDPTLSLDPHDASAMLTDSAAAEKTRRTRIALASP